MEQFEHYESILYHLQGSDRLACHSKKGSNQNVTYIDTFYPSGDDQGYKLTVIDLESQSLLHFDIELDFASSTANVAYLGLLDLPEEVEDFVDASVKRMGRKLIAHQKLRERRESQKHLPPEERDGFSKKNWRGFFVEYVTQQEPDLDNRLAIMMGHADEEIVDHLKSLGLGFKYYYAEMFASA